MTERRTRIPMAIAGLALVAATGAACGSDDGDDSTASDPTASSTSAGTSASASGSPSVSDSPSTSASPTDNGDPVPSPIVNKAVKAAIADDFPALVPAGVPAGWTVTKATYSPKRGGLWWIYLTDPTGAQVTLAQSKKSVDGLVGQYLPNAQATGTVNLSGTGKWETHGATAAAAVAKALSGTSAIVVGPDQDTVVTFAQQLLTAEDAGNTDGG